MEFVVTNHISFLMGFCKVIGSSNGKLKRNVRWETNKGK